MAKATVSFALAEVVRGTTARAAAKGAQVGAQRVVDYAADSIRKGAVSGPGHVPSKPGQPPNADTHTLDASGHVVPLENGGRVVFDAPYAAAQEYGTLYLPERPYVRPSLVANEQAIVADVAAAIAPTLSPGNVPIVPVLGRRD